MLALLRTAPDCSGDHDLIIVAIFTLTQRMAAEWKLQVLLFAFPVPWGEPICVLFFESTLNTGQKSLECCPTCPCTHAQPPALILLQHVASLKLPVEEEEEAFYIRVPSPIVLIGWNIQPRSPTCSQWQCAARHHCLKEVGIVANIPHKKHP